MNKPQVSIFQLKSIKRALRQTVALSGLLSMLLTVSCGPAGSDSKLKTTVPSQESLELKEGIQVQPELGAQENLNRNGMDSEIEVPDLVAETQEEKKQPTPAVVIPMTESSGSGSVSSNSNSNSNTNSNSNGTSPENSVKTADMKATVTRLNSSFHWAMMPLFLESYQDPNGEVHEHFKVLSGESEELENLLTKMRDDLVARDRTKDHVQFEVQPAAVCKEREQKSLCGSRETICLSEEGIQERAVTVGLEQAARGLIMQNFARQHCASEELATQVVQYYDLPAIKNMTNTNQAVSTFNRVRNSLQNLKNLLSTSVVGSKAQVCILLEQVVGQAVLLQKQDIAFANPATRAQLPGAIQAAAGSYCESESNETESLKSGLNKATQIYDQIAQEFTKNSGVVIYDFSKHLWPYKK